MILILGLTASGKGQLAWQLAKQTGAEIISIDSMKVYRRMDIGTAKPPAQARKEVNYHLIDVVEPSDSFNVGKFLDSAYDSITQIKSRRKDVIAVGGTALYIKALLYGLFEGPPGDSQIREQLADQAKKQGLEKLYDRLKTTDPAAADRIHPHDSNRIIRALEVHQLTGKGISALQKQFNAEKTRHNWTIIGLAREKTDISGRINRRVKKMFDNGLVEEVKALLAEEKPLSQQARCAIGYAEIIDCLHGRTALQDCVELVKKNTRRLAKNQRTWFKTFRNVHWLEIEPQEGIEKTLLNTKKLLESAAAER